MKKLLVLMLVFVIASLANAIPGTLQISVDGVVDPPESEIVLEESEHAVIDVHSFNNTAVLDILMFTEGNGVLSLDPGWIIDIAGINETLLDQSANPGVIGWLVSMGYSPTSVIAFTIATATVPIPAVPDGKIVDLIDFHCTGADLVPYQGETRIVLFDAASQSVVDTQVIHQIPEPMTIALLGLGGLLLRRRR